MFTEIMILTADIGIGMLVELQENPVGDLVVLISHFIQQSINIFWLSTAKRPPTMTFHERENALYRRTPV